MEGSELGRRREGEEEWCWWGKTLNDGANGSWASTLSFGAAVSPSGPRTPRPANRVFKCHIYINIINGSINAQEK